ncbi:venom carboxylesterase-6-like isoform X1 [Amphibalanus amphitrite]|uniref:venom carboxylesterase-6-like isoform X1 n=1 Tax=Amphibalanus amphitrite TaxID=1232801 RepID=UPI001C904D38|nr:venom carboxylesterase-6-like isoform X1 [Amphibalanus amphitrite]
MMLRVRHLTLFLAASILLLVSAAVSEGPIISTQNGDIRGEILKSFLGNEFASFKGIPYGAPPLGSLRFRPPEPHGGWQGVRNATEHGSKCLQFNTFSGALEGDEDCLFLNVYTARLPTATEKVRLPVLVWLHGGAFIFGDGDASPLFGPEYFMDQQVVLVTINNRLGPFGFLTTGDEAAPGNYGLHDQRLALQWVRDNIAAFGGDPNQVTLFGESAGGAGVGLHVLSPLSKGLFARAISQSGASFCNFAASGEPQGDLAMRHAELLRCPSGSSQDVVTCLREKPATEVMIAVQKLETDLVVGLPIVYKARVDVESDTPFLPEDPHLLLREGRFSRVPWLHGITHDEGAFMIGTHSAESPPKYSSRDWNVWAKDILAISKVTEDPPAMAEKIYRFYFGQNSVGEGNLERLVEVYTDRTIAACTSKEADLASAHTPVYRYVLNHMGPGRQSFAKILSAILGTADGSVRDYGVSHTDDLLYLFKNGLAPPVALGSEEHKMIHFMVSLWTSFARQGYPSTDVVSMPRWPVYTAEDRQHMWLNNQPSVGSAAFSERIAFWRGLEINESWRAPQGGSTLQKDEL